jgi:hypothetical protein
VARPTSDSTTRAVSEFRKELRAMRMARIKVTRGLRAAVLRDAALLAGIHRTTLSRALGDYKGKVNGHARRRR